MDQHECPGLGIAQPVRESVFRGFPPGTGISAWGDAALAAAVFSPSGFQRAQRSTRDLDRAERVVAPGLEACKLDLVHRLNFTVFS